MIGPWAIETTGQLLLLLALVSATRRDHGRQRGDVLTLLVLLILPGLFRFPAVAPLADAAFTFVPFVLLRLSRQFRPIARWVLVPTAVLSVISFATIAGFPSAVPAGAKLSFRVVMIALFVLAAVAHASEATRSIGIRRARLLLAGAAALLLPVGLAITVTQAFVDGLEGHNELVSAARGLAFIAVYFAFTPPHWVFSRWQRGQQSRFFEHTGRRDPEARGEHAPDDVFDAACRSVGGALTFVALYEKGEGSGRGLVIRASSDPSVAGTIPSEGLTALALEQGRAVAGAVAQAGPALSSHLAGYGETLLVAPLVADGHSWGVLAVVHRRGALFPEDDLALLGELAQAAAVHLDHASLITDRRERARSEADKRMREMETRVALMLESIKDYGMLVLDAGGQVGAWQPGAQHIFGYSASDITGRSAAALFDVSDDDFLGWLAQACEHGHAERENTCRRENGSTFVGVTTIRPLVNEMPGRGGFVVVTHDVTQRRALDERARQGQKMEAIGRLAGGVAHDFNNLLMVILGHADWLERGLRGDPRLEEVAGIQNAAERAADLTRRLLAFSRRNVLQPSRVSLSALVADMLPMLRRVIRDNIEIVDATSPMVPAVLGDYTQLQQVLLNLVINGRDAMPDGGRITVRTADTWLESGGEGGASERHVLLEVTDTGMGMDAETRRLAFEPFFTTKDVGKGTGLGLSSVYGIVQQLGGRIQLESEPGRGTTIRLYFPETRCPANSAVQAAAFEALPGPDTLM